MSEQNYKNILNVVLDPAYISDPELLLESDNFKEKISEVTYKVIIDNIEHMPKKITLFNLIDLGLKITITRKECYKFLNNMLDSYIKLEDFNKCEEISTYIKQLDGNTK